MLHHYTKDGPDGSHWAVGKNALGDVLVQVAEKDGTMSRIGVTPDEAEEIAQELIAMAARARAARPHG